MWRHPLATLSLLAIVAMAMASLLPKWFSEDLSPVRGLEKGRLVSMTPSVTETIIKLGAIESLVARSDYCLDAALPADLTKVGTGLQPNYEALVRVRPTHILATAAQGLAQEALSQIAPTTALPWRTLAQMIESIGRLGVLVDKDAEAQALVQELRNEVLVDAPKGAPRALLLIGFGALNEGELWFIKPGSLHDEVLGAAGAANVIEGPVEGAPSMPFERLLTLDPDLIIVLSSKGGMSEADKAALIEPLMRMTTLRAAQGGRVGVLARDNVLGEGPSLVELVAPMRALIRDLMRLEGER